MRIRRDRLPFAVVVPVHNEARRLPRLLAALRAQTAVDVPVVFVDNGSTDDSGALLRAGIEAAGRRWVCLEEQRVGKAAAMATATAYCAGELGVRHVGFLDADTTWLDERWLETSARLAGELGTALGYVVSPLTYCGLERSPVFAGANRACEAVLHRVVRTGVSFAHAGAGTFPIDLVQRFLRDAEPVAEQGLRLSLLALSAGRSPRLNPGLVASSGRRIVASGINLRRWCFYDRDFYRQKDINAAAKLDLEAPTPAPDLDPAEVGQFFARQALKIATRNVACPALFDATGTIAPQADALFAADFRPLKAELAGCRGEAPLLAGGWDELLQAISGFRATTALAKRLEDRMLEQYRVASAPEPASSSTAAAHRHDELGASGVEDC